MLKSLYRLPSRRIFVTNRRFYCSNSIKMKDPWEGVEVTDLEGQQVLLADQWKDKRVVLFLVRRFG